MRFGEVGLLIVPRDDVAASTAEPARVIINLHVTDARAAARHLDALKVTWLAPLEYREPDGAWFGTVSDPDGNYVQIIELTPAYWSARHQRARQAGRGPLAHAAVSVWLPAQDLDRARQFYAEKLGLEPAEERPGGLRYQCGAGTFSIFHSGGQPAGTHTQLAWQVGDLDAVATELRQRGVAFEDVDTPGCARPAESPRSPETTRPPAAAANGPPGSMTAKATSSASARPSRPEPDRRHLSQARAMM